MAVYDKLEIGVGQTIYGQPLRLVNRRDTGGRSVWELHRDEANQRDDRVFIGGLTPEVILRIAAAVKELSRK